MEPQQVDPLDSILAKNGVKPIDPLDDILAKNGVKPTEQTKEEPSFLSRSIEGVKGIGSFLGNALEAGSGDLGALQRMTSGVGKQLEDLPNHPIAGTVGLLTGINPNQVGSDISQGRYGAALGDVLPQIGAGILMHKIGGMGGEVPKPIEAPAIIPDIPPTESVIPARSVDPNIGNFVELPTKVVSGTPPYNTPQFGLKPSNESLPYPLNIVPNRLRPPSTNATVFDALLPESLKTNQQGAATPLTTSVERVTPEELSQHQPEKLAQIIDSNPDTIGQRPIPDIINSQPIDPVIPSDITIPRAGQAKPTVDVGKWSANLNSADKILDRYESTAPISEMIRNAQDSKLPFINQTLKSMEPYLGSNDLENQTIFQALDGKIDPATLSSELQAKTQGLRQILDKVHEGLPGDVGYISDYITHMRDGGSPSQQTLWGYYFDKFKNRNLPTTDALQPGNPAGVGNVSTPYVKPRTGELVDYSTDLPRVLRAYVSSIAKTKFDDPAVNSAKELLQSIPETLPKVRAVADAYIRNYTGYDAEGQLAREFKDWSNAVANTYVRSYLDWNVPLHMLHLGEIPASVFPELGTKYTAIGAKDFASSPARLTRELASNGLLQNSVIPPRFQTFGERYQTAANFWNIAESVTKGIAYSGAKARALDMGMTPQQATMKAIADTKDMTYVSDPARMIKGLNNQSNIAGGQVASRIGQQFKGVPLKIIEQYQNILRNIDNSPNPNAARARLIFGAGLAAGGTTLGLHTFHMNPSNLLKPTVLGPYGDTLLTAATDLAKGDLPSAIGNTMAFLIPGGQQAKKLIK